MIKGQREGMCAIKQGSFVSKGTLASVYKCRMDLPGNANVAVALKEFTVPAHRDDDAAMMRDDIISSMLGEYRDVLLNREALPLHPHVAAYYGVEYNTGASQSTLDRVLLTTDWVEANGKKLRGPLPELEVKSIAKGIVGAVAHLHKHDVSHDDLRPCNVFTTVAWSRPTITDTTVPHVVVTDYRLTKHILRLIDPESGGVTTKQRPQYCAPEVFTDGSNYDPMKCDVWGIGGTVLEFLSGKPPFVELDPSGKGSIMFKIIQSRAPPKYPDGLSVECKAFLDSCFTREYSRRPAAATLLEHSWIR